MKIAYLNTLIKRTLFMTLRDEKAVILFSGGQDSAVCLLYALEHFACVETIGFNYGQRHNIEMQIRQEFLQQFKQEFPHYADKIGDDHVYDLSVLSDIGETSLTQETEIKMLDCGLPSTFVPGRNIMFFTVAAASAWRRGSRHIIGGMCQTDFSGYPDCRDNAIKAMQVALSAGLDYPITLHTPLMWINKSQTWDMAYRIAGQKAVDFIIEHTHSCYKGVRNIRHIWGYGCDDCPACDLRKKGYLEYIAN